MPCHLDNCGLCAEPLPPPDPALLPAFVGFNASFIPTVFSNTPVCQECSSMMVRRGETHICVNCDRVTAPAIAPAITHLLTVRGMTRSDAELARDPVWLGLVEQARAAGWVR